MPNSRGPNTLNYAQPAAPTEGNADEGWPPGLIVVLVVALLAIAGWIILLCYFFGVWGKPAMYSHSAPLREG